VKIDSPELRAAYRGIPCEWCRLEIATDAAHLFAKGMGGGGQLDVRFNLAGLCRICHARNHAANSGLPTCRPTFLDLLKLIARREKLPTDTILERIFMLRRLPKDAELPSWLQ
jgi:hypothetical protein